MVKTIAILAGCVLAMSLPGQSRVDRKFSTRLVGNIKNEQMMSGCGCSFGFPANERRGLSLTAYWSSLAETDAYMNIDGEDVKLAQVKTTRTDKKPFVGERFSESYVANGVKVSLLYLTTAVCGPKEEDCEAISYDVAITVVKGPRRQTVKLIGACGC
jgi:hypothetical protein